MLEMKNITWDFFVRKSFTKIKFLFFQKKFFQTQFDHNILRFSIDF